MGIFRNLNRDPDPMAHITTPEEADKEATKWGERARKSALDGHPDSAQYSREARAAAQDKGRKLRGLR